MVQLVSTFTQSDYKHFETLIITVRLGSFVSLIVFHCVRLNYFSFRGNSQAVSQAGNDGTNRPSPVDYVNTKIYAVSRDYCGDGIKSATEQCDDGNSVDKDECSNSCIGK